MQVLGDCCALVRKEFPTIDDVLLNYVESILETSGDDFENEEDIFEAIGAVLQEVDQSKTEDSIKTLCSRLIRLIQGSGSISTNVGANDMGSNVQNGIKKLTLDSPVHLGALVEKQSSTQEIESMWLNKQEVNSSNVDSKKLEKAEAQLQKKQEKKETTPTPVRYKSCEASANQVISRKDANDDPNNAANNTKDIRIENFDISFGDKVLIQNANITMSYGRRYGLVGRNGLGKSTLLKMISSRQLIIPAHLSILHVEQEVIGDDTVALQSVLEALVIRESLLKEEKEINAKMSSGESSESATARLAAIYTELEVMESDKAPSRASVILAGLGFTTEMQRAPTKSFSGGWRMRLALARALFCKPDLLLLDEPTNMLDMQAIIWLERYLQTWPSTLLVVSHDRSFLDEVPTDMMHLHTQRIEQYRGNYSQFVTTMTERLKSQQREYEAQMDYRKHIQDFINKFRFNAKRASLVQSRIKHLESLPVLQPVDQEKEVVLKFPDVEKLSPPILMLSGVSYAYPNSTKGNIFNNCDLSATQESRICIVGENGAGKTTLLKLIMDHISPTQGRRDAHRNLKFGYFSQHHVDQLDMNVSILLVYQIFS